VVLCILWYQLNTAFMRRKTEKRCTVLCKSSVFIEENLVTRKLRTQFFLVQYTVGVLLAVVNRELCSTELVGKWVRVQVLVILVYQYKGTSCRRKIEKLCTESTVFSVGMVYGRSRSTCTVNCVHNIFWYCIVHCRYCSR